MYITIVGHIGCLIATCNSFFTVKAGEAPKTNTEALAVLACHSSLDSKLWVIVNLLGFVKFSYSWLESIIFLLTSAWSCPLFLAAWVS